MNVVAYLPKGDWLKNKILEYRLGRRFENEFNRFKGLYSDARFGPLRWEDKYPCLDDRSTTTPYDSHYVLHTAWAARVLARSMPTEHVDISSYLYFSTIVSAFVPVRFYDYRPAFLDLDGLETEAADVMSLPLSEGSVASLSCMHVIEHIGLGRYGDPIDPEGDVKAITELKRVIAPGGQLLFVVPVGNPKIRFNAHRIYAYDQVTGYFDGFLLEEFSLVVDGGPDGEKPVSYVECATKELADKQNYGCGMFLFKKKTL